MAKLTRAQRSTIASALHDAERALKYIMREDVAVARLSARPSTVLDYSREIAPDAAETLRVPAGRSALTPVAKDIGSDLVGLAQAVSTLRSILAS